LFTETGAFVGQTLGKKGKNETLTLSRIAFKPKFKAFGSGEEKKTGKRGEEGWQKREKKGGKKTKREDERQPVQLQRRISRHPNKKKKSLLKPKPKTNRVGHPLPASSISEGGDCFRVCLGEHFKGKNREQGGSA